MIFSFVHVLDIKYNYILLRIKLNQLFPRLKGGLVRPVMDVASYYQLALGVEILRAPEVLFQPSILGIDQSGLSDCLEYMLNYYPQDLQQRLAQVHWLGGGDTAH